MNKVIELRCSGHSAEYELNNIIHLFIPYLQENYLLEASYEADEITAKLLKGNDLVMTVRHQLLSVPDDWMHKKNIREALKRAVYNMLSELTGIQMPWGILTGIRPTKIVHDYLEKGLTDDNIVHILKTDYKVSGDKVNLLIEVAKEERAILQQNKPNEINLYIGIPFCPTRCVYCSFTAYSLEKKAGIVEQYLEALFKEIAYIAETQKDKPIRSLYIGGGTPTSLSENQLLRLLEHISKQLDLTLVEEYTVEAGRPDTITVEKLEIMKKWGVNRISINPQSMNQKTLDVIGRKHTVEDIEKVFQSARACGHQNINMDIIVGLPGELIEDVENTLIKLTALNPDNITVHTMAVKRASRLKEEEAQYHLTERHHIEQMLKLCEKYLHRAGLKPYYMYRQKNMLGNYENVGYAKPGKACIYNVEIMEEKQTIIALGAGAITKIVYQNGERIDRIPNVKNVEEYITRIDEMILRKQQGFIKYQ